MRIFRRRIKLFVLLNRGVCYRLFVVLMNFLFNYFAIKGLIKLVVSNYFGFAIGYTICWNIVNTLLYYLFHYVWDRNFKLGKD